jgi:ribose transport system permease protein
MTKRSAIERILAAAEDRTYVFAAVLFVILFALNVISLPAFVAPQFIGPTLLLLAPLIIAAVASTPAVMSGGGGIDLSVGPLLGFVNVIIVTRLVPMGLDSPPVLLAAVLGVCLVVGLFNGFMVAAVRLQPVVATLGMYLILTGLSLRELPSPGHTAPEWLLNLGGSIAGFPGALIFIAVPVIAWWLLRQTAFYKALVAVGGDERAAFSAGVDIVRVRVATYCICAVFAGVAGLALTSLIRSGDALQGPNFTVVSLAAVAVGGTSFAGGRGGIAGTIFGALDIFLIQNLLTSLHVPNLWLQVVYGSILLAALLANSALRARRTQRLVQ